MAIVVLRSELRIVFLLTLNRFKKLNLAQTFNNLSTLNILLEDLVNTNT